MPSSISLRIDGKFIRAAKGQTILEAASSAGKFIPASCNMKGLSAVGALRVCVMEVAGVNLLLPACTTLAQTTTSEKLRKYRCVRTCAEVDGAHVWDIAGRGVQSRLIAEMSQPWGTSRNCTDCGKCVQSCPTGALAEKGYAVEEMTKRSEPIIRLAAHREASL